MEPVQMPQCPFRWICGESLVEITTHWDLLRSWDEDAGLWERIVPAYDTSEHPSVFLTQDGNTMDSKSKTDWTYGATGCSKPDVAIDDGLPKEKLDPWSAVIFCDAAVWVIEGYGGIESYRKLASNYLNELTCLTGHSLFESYCEAYTRLSSSKPPTTSFKNCILCFWRSKALRFLKRRDRALGTCEWLLEGDKFVEWRNTRNTSLLWMYGSPGAGKSTICSAIIDSLEADRRDGETMAYYFADGSVKSSNTAFGILAAIAIKMMARGATRKAHDRMESLLNELDAVGEQLSSSRIREFLLEIRHNLSSEETLYVVLDGLDDAEESQSTIDLLQEIIYLVNQRDGRHSMKFFISSRPSLFHGKDLRGALHMDIDKESSLRNVLKMYIDQRMEKLLISSTSQDSSQAILVNGRPRKFWEVAQQASAVPFILKPISVGNHGGVFQAANGRPRDALINDISQQITGRAQGTFLWAFLVIEELAKTNYFHSSIHLLLENSGIGDSFGVYKNMIGCISERDRPVALQLLRWIIYTARPLYCWELLDAISLQLGKMLEVSDIQKICGGLLRTSEAGTVSLVHMSAREYLQSRSGEDDIMGWSVISGTSHEMIAQTCLQVLKPNHFMESLSMSRSTGWSSELAGEPSRTLQAYAFHYWKFHYNLAESQSSHLPGMLHKFLRESWDCGDEASSKKSHFGSHRETKGFLGFPFHTSGLSSLAPMNAALRGGARHGMLKLTKLELEMGASPNVTDSLGNTALHYAASAGHLKVMQLLIEYGADVNAASTCGATALSYAVANWNIEAVKLLLTAGAEAPDIRPKGHGNLYIHSPPSSIAQKLSLVVTLSINCPSCGDLQSRYILSKPPSSNGDGDERWAPIHVRGETLSQAEITGTEEPGQGTEYHGPLPLEERAMVKWFPGVGMYEALAMAASSGMENVIRLLVVAGNDVSFLDRSVCLSKLISKMKI